MAFAASFKAVAVQVNVPSADECSANVFDKFDP